MSSDGSVTRWAAALKTGDLAAALLLVCRKYLSRNRATTETECLSDLLQYHQLRNAAATRFRKNRP